jgi:hypothetical protein
VDVGCTMWWCCRSCVYILALHRWVAATGVLVGDLVLELLWSVPVAYCLVEMQLSSHCTS